MNKRNGEGKSATQHSVKYLVFIWACSLLSLLLLYFAGNAVTDSMAAFQSCNSNSTGLSVHNCGKQGLNVGDIILFGLFALSAALSVSLFTASWRATRGRE
jgi:hypothetical protein